MINYQIRQCSQADCHFRYPALAHQPSSDRCPRCGAPAIVVREALRNPEATTSKQTLPLRPIKVLMDNLRSAWNVGSILRTADGAGVQHAYLCGISPTPEHTGVQKTALGAEKSIAWSWHANSLDLASQLTDAGHRLWALEEAPEAESIFNCGLERPALPLVLVVGNEISGVDPELLACCERVFHIPMSGIKRSINVAVAAGIAIYALHFHIPAC
jgi:23S rRNA (guanosine2251-2'-O)-methyltransferase